MGNYRLFIAGFMSFALFIALRYTYDSSFFVSFDENMRLLFAGNKLIGLFHYLGETKFIIFITLFLLLWLWFKFQNYWGMFFVTLTIPVGILLNQLVKKWVKRPRPEIEDQLASFSFPSGHAMVGMLYLFTIAFLLSERTSVTIMKWLYWIGAGVIAFFIGLSRVAESRHFATDVIAGWLLGLTWFCICVYLYKNLKRNQITEK
ncbi:phosphatase PAP2 family protein [Ureibacillus sp. FSL K6-8385]|nr:phosphatase PAP2 family protein [Ureibacillus terrenus]MED3662235.1 phosphatase PAP2 family protein [Ureibacillus terrenus]MED3764071.1 phosphatase PAP2 family protein [Ureibacillus terrenus]